MQRQLQDQVQVRLREASKSRSIAIFERLVVLEGELRMIGFNLDSGAAAFTQGSFDDDFKLRFKGLAFSDPSGEEVRLFGQSLDLPDLAGDEMEHLGTAQSLLSTDFQEDGSATLGRNIRNKGEAEWLASEIEKAITTEAQRKF